MIRINVYLNWEVIFQHFNNPNVNIVITLIVIKEVEMKISLSQVISTNLNIHLFTLSQLLRYSRIGYIRYEQV